MKSCMTLTLAQGIGQLKWAWFREPRTLKDIQIYDDASRGPLGACKLIFTATTMHKVASLGAIATCLLLFVDPFAQQLLRYYNCPQTISDNSPVLPIALMYREYGGQLGATPGMISAINSGLFSPGQYRYFYSCETGNCTVDAQYSSLGFCYACTDLSSQTRIVTSTPEQYSSWSLLNYTRYTSTILATGLTAT